MMGPVDVGHQGRKFVLEGVGHITLAGQMVTFIRIYRFHHVENAGETLHRTRMNPEPRQEVFDSGHAMLRIFDRRPPDDPVHFIPLFQKQFRKIASILARDPGD